MFKKILEKWLGLDQLKHEIEEAQRVKLQALEEATEAQEAVDKAKIAREIAELSPKHLASQQGLPWVDVNRIHFNPDNVRNGFFEMDWNQEFVDHLKAQGYGLDGDSDESIVDRWFRILCIDVANEEGIDMSQRGSGYINVTPISGDRSEVS